MNLNSGFSKDQRNVDPIVNLFSQGLKASAQIITTVFLARSLPPEAFGYFAFALGVLIVFESIRDFGFTSLSMQEPSPSREIFERNFRIMSSRGILLSAGMYSFTFLLGQISDSKINPLLISNLIILSAVPIVAGISGAFNIQLWKTRSVKKISILDLIAFFSSILILPISVKFQILENAMALQIIVYQLVQLVLKLAVIKQVPRVVWKFTRFELNYRATPQLGYLTLLRLFTENIDTFLIGILLGPNSLGLYNRGYQVSHVPIQLGLESQTNYVIRRSIGDDNFKNISHIFSIVSLPILSFLVFVAINSRDFLSFLYGNNWEEASPILSILCLVGILRCFEYKLYWILLVSKQHKMLLKRNVYQALLLAIGISVGSIYGAVGVSIGILLALSANLFRTLIRINDGVLIILPPIFKTDLSGILIVIVFQLLPWLVERLWGVALDLKTSFAYMVAIIITSSLVQFAIKRHGR